MADLGDLLAYSDSGSDGGEAEGGAADAGAGGSAAGGAPASPARSATPGRACEEEREEEASPAAPPAALDLPPGFPPPPAAPVPPALAARVAAMLAAVAAGRSMGSELRGRRAYRNPDFLAKAVAHYGLDPHASMIAPPAWDAGPVPADVTADALDAALGAARAARCAPGRAALEFAPAAPGPGGGGGRRRGRWDQ